MELPQDFTRRMEKILGKNADVFFSSYHDNKTYGIRFNPLKNRGFLSSGNTPFTLASIPWAEDGFYGNPEEHPGKHPLHEAGAYYIQEPSAMAVVSLLSPMPGEIICDLCAAPGGKSTAIGGRMMGKGLLVSNEIIPGRAKILSQNIERLGVANCVVTNEPPERMAKIFPDFFDKVLVDAPCSGEGMFRKDTDAIKEWSLSQIEICRERQKTILEEADKILRPGGTLVYSTCTFAPEENEKQIADFLAKHPRYTLEDWRDFLPHDCGLTGGISDDAPGAFEAQKTLRLWPHLVKGEGHFTARLHKSDSPSVPSKKKDKRQNNFQMPADLKSFSHKHLCLNNGSGSVSGLFHEKNLFHSFGDEIYLVPSAMKHLDGIKLLRAGLQLGTQKKNRFEPSHALAMALLPTEVQQIHPCDDQSIWFYLRGESLSCDPALHAWTLITYKDFSIGWGKANNGVLKNHYPKGLRIH